MKTTKKYLLIIIGLILSLNINAQWYYRSFHLTNINDLNQDQLNLSYTKSLKIIKTGQYMLGSGIGIVLFGISLDAILSKNLDKKGNKLLYGIYIRDAGVIIASAGIPFWISGAKRKKNIEIALIKYNHAGSASINGVGIKIRF